MDELKITARRKIVTLTGHLPPAFYSFIAKLPGYKKYTATGAVFAANRTHIDLFREMFPDTEIVDQDGSIAALYKPIPPIVEHERRTESQMPLFAHQKHALNVGLSRDIYGFFYSMGTGKTAIMLHIAAELFARNEIDRAIIVTTKRVVPQLVNEQAPMHMPKGVKYKIAQFPSTQANKLFKYPEYHLLIAVAGYGALQSKNQTQELIEFAKNKRTALFLDESQNIKGWSTKRVENLWDLRPHILKKYLFSGEPAPLGPIDLFSQFQFLDENIVGHSSLTSFKNAFCIMGGYEGREIVSYRNLDALAKSISPHSQYLKLADVLDMPEQIYHTVTVEPSREQRNLYASMKEDFVIAVDQASRESDGAVATKLAKTAASKFMSLQQISNGFFYTDAEEGEARGKLITINDDRAEYVAQELIERQGKTVVFCRFHGDMDSLERAFKKEGINSVEFSGRKDDAHNERARLAFVNDPNVQVFVATQASGGTGLNLQVANRTIYFSNSFSYGDRIQSESRTWRAGQNRRCVYYDVIMFPIDRLILENLRKKQDLSQQLSKLSSLKELAGRL